jgi:tRNA-(ms[2]io[6]A)-hydroxylase
MAVSGSAPEAVLACLDVATPEAWVRAARDRLPELLLDHANCELKAAATALDLIRRYPGRRALAERMSRLAREELRHFEQVMQLMDRLSVPFRRLSASRYAAALNAAVRRGEPERLLDRLLVGALIEARSCERFGAVAPHLPAEVREFYRGLLASEARHFAHYLAFARSETGVGEAALDARLAELRALEARLVATPDPEFRFHSGVPAPEQQPADR